MAGAACPELLICWMKFPVMPITVMRLIACMIRVTAKTFPISLDLVDLESIAKDL